MSEKFVVVFDDKTIALASETRVSNMFDLADCDSMDQVAGIYAADENANLVKVTVGPQTPNPDREYESQLYYGRAPIMAGKRLVGFVHLTNH